MDGQEERELTSMKSNSVFTECNLPAGRKTVKTSEFTRKAHKHGNIERYEARLEAMCTVLALSALFSYMVHQMNIYSGSQFIVEGRSIYRGTSGV